MKPHSLRTHRSHIIRVPCGCCERRGWIQTPCVSSTANFIRCVMLAPGLVDRTNIREESLHSAHGVVGATVKYCCVTYEQLEVTNNDCWIPIWKLLRMHGPFALVDKAVLRIRRCDCYAKECTLDLQSSSADGG